MSPSYLINVLDFYNNRYFNSIIKDTNSITLKNTLPDSTNIKNIKPVFQEILEIYNKFEPYKEFFNLSISSKEIHIELKIN